MHGKGLTTSSSFPFQPLQFFLDTTLSDRTMNFFGGNGNAGPTPLTVAKVEAEILTDMFNK